MPFTPLFPKIIFGKFWRAFPSSPKQELKKKKKKQKSLSPLLSSP